MNKIGRQVCMLTTSQNNSRNGEGSFIRLGNGDILFGFTEFISSGREDEDMARISCIISKDDGESWSERNVLFTAPENALNIMSVSFLRMQNGDIGAFYIVKHADATDDIVLTRSADEGKTWSDPIACTQDVLPRDYYVMNNDRAVRLKSGRILLPLARHSIHTQCEDFPAGELCFIYSDDDGISWKTSPDVIRSPFSNDKNGFQEPGIFELRDGSLWCYIRTGLGCQYEAFSTDGGLHWSDPQPNLYFSSPCSPMLVKMVDGITVAIFNPIPEHILRDDEKEFWGRTPFVMAVNRNGETAFTQDELYYLEDDLSNGYCYPAVIECNGGFIVSYYHSNNSDCCLNSTKLIKINYTELL